MTDPQLVAPNGTAIAPEHLVARRGQATATELGQIRTAARRCGRVLERDGFGLYGLGEAAAIELPGGLGEKGAARAAAGLLAGITRRDDARPLAIGALPFLPTSPGRLVLPTLTLVVRAGAASLVVVGPRSPAAASPELGIGELTEAANQAGDAPPESFRLTPIGSHEFFRERVRGALKEIESGALDKVVLAREVRVEADREFQPGHLVARLRQLHPSCLTFSVEGIVGASPELLVRREHDAVNSAPLAGTVGRSGDPDQDRQLAAAMLASEKERREHGFVVEAIRDALAPFVRELSAPESPHLLELRNVVHLATAVRGTLGAERASALELVAALHPTPAVCGTPRDAALELLGRSEPARDRYAGPVGYLDSDGDGEFWLAIRCAILSGREARLLAGVGIVAGSVPEDELAETQLKLQALLAAAVRP